MNRKALLLLSVVIIATFVIRYFLLGGAPVVKLANAPQLGGIISQSLNLSGSKVPPTIGKDYSLDNVKYFDDSNWVVVSIKPIKNNLNFAVVILQKQNNSYRKVLGPGSDFDSSYLLSFPAGVGQYLKNLGVVHGPTSQ